MARPRIDLTDIPFHVFCRGNNKQNVFFDERDRLVYLKIWKQAHERFQFALHTFVLMNNHIHLLLMMKLDSSLSKLMHWVHFHYASYINQKYERVGHLFQGRFHSIPIEKDNYFLAVDRYIHLNPVKAGMVQKPEDFPWSSYRDRLSSSPSDWIAHSDILDYFGKDLLEQKKKYRKFTEEGIPLEEAWPDETLKRIDYLGSWQFVQEIQHRKSQKP